MCRSEKGDAKVLEKFSLLRECERNIGKAMEQEQIYVTK